MLLIVFLLYLSAVATNKIIEVEKIENFEKNNNQVVKLNNIYPPALHKLGAVQLISPASPYSYEVENVTLYLENLRKNFWSLYETEVIYSRYMNETYGYLAGTDAHRASDVMSAFRNANAHWVLANRGGFGCARMIDALDYNYIKSHPKVIMGYSDLTALINAIHQKTGLVTFYGPMGIDKWTNLNGEYVKRVAFNGELVEYKNPPYNKTTTLRSGKAKGRLIGGNLSVFVSIIGSSYLPTSWENVILFLEDVDEHPYTIDRMLQTLYLSGILKNVSGVIWGTCNRCGPPNPVHSLTMDQVLNFHLKQQLTVPSYIGALIGHIDEQFTIPIGVMAEMDADSGTFRLLEKAVK